ncbi:MAG: ion transporter [Alphaproteobacteria bacterium]|nr:ion transporter [Alphaproteobacteria bacterium]
MVARKKTIKDQLYYNDDGRRLAKLISGLSFDLFIMGVILADAIVLGLMTSEWISTHFDMDLFLLDRLFMGIFIVEMFLKLYAFKRKFFSNGWNIFDLFVVVISSIPEANSFIVLRTFRLFRLLKYVHHFSKMNNMIQIFISLLPTFASFLAVFSIFTYIFAIMGVSLFGDVFLNFSSLGSAMFTLLQGFTLDGWASSIARPIMVVYPHAWLYFVSLVVVAFFILVSFALSALRQVIDMAVKK